MNKFVDGDSHRIFINTVLGCKSKCKYCYLSSLGIHDKGNEIKSEDAVAQLQKLPFFRKGKQGTILSIGCYSECWDESNKIETIKLLEYLSVFGNYIQMATKQFISIEEAEKINSICKYPKQIGVYISLPTITFSERLEEGTAIPSTRIKSLENCLNMDKLYVVLYIKPVLKNITIRDVILYSKILDKYRIPAIVGPQLIYDDNGTQLVGSNFFSIKSNEDVELIMSKLRKKHFVIQHSSEIIEKIRNVEGKA